MTRDDSFLRTIRSALGRAPGGVRSKEHYPELFKKPDNAAALATHAGRSYQEQHKLIEILEENAMEINTVIHHVNSFEEANGVIVELVRSKEPEFSSNKHITQHHHPDLDALQLWKKFNREAVTMHTSFSYDREIQEKTAASFIGITAPSIAVADSATLVQITSPGCPRSTSLVPSIHIALVRRQNIVANLTEAYALLGEMKGLDSMVFISGPSKTADIEAHLVHGAHGPKELHLVILSEPEIFTEPEEITEPEQQEISP